MRKLVVASQKGGVGKTTTALNLGAALEEMGCRVLLIDLDPQGSLTAALGVDPYSIRRSSYALLSRDHTSLAHALIHVTGLMALVPATPQLSALQMRLGPRRDAVYRLHHALERTRVPFDYVIIDTPPNVGVLTVNALVAGDEIIIPLTCQYLAMRGVRALYDLHERVREHFNPDLHLLGILLTRYVRGSLHAQEVVAEVRTVFPQETFRAMIPESEDLAEAPIIGQSIFQYAPLDPAAMAFRDVAKEIAHERQPE
ncbi:MAG: ParA family protein [Anaerolineae bacterium]|nr:ParA family protein [Anaerolineae bacterium]